MWARDLGAAALAVSPCDVPLLPDDLFLRLAQQRAADPPWPRLPRVINRCAHCGPSAHCHKWPKRWRVVRIRHMAAAADAGCTRVRFAEEAAFANVNTRADLAAIAARVGE